MSGGRVDLIRAANDSLLPESLLGTDESTNHFNYPLIYVIF